MKAKIKELKSVVEKMHKCKATFVEFEKVIEKFNGEVVWDGEVAVFTLDDHPISNICYAWSSSVPRTQKERFFAVLKQPPINSAVKALSI